LKTASWILHIPGNGHQLPLEASL